MSKQMLMAMLVATSAMSGGKSFRDIPDPLEDVELEAEYNLIQKKKSKLSANKRRMVVARYEAKKGQTDE